MTELMGGRSWNQVLEAFLVLALRNCAVLLEAQLLEVPGSPVCQQAAPVWHSTCCQCRQSTQAICVVACTARARRHGFVFTLLFAVMHQLCISSASGITVTLDCWISTGKWRERNM